MTSTDEESAAEESVDPSTDSWDVSLADLESDSGPDPIEAGTLSAEHTVFVVLGVLLTLAVIYRIVTLVGATVG